MHVPDSSPLPDALPTTAGELRIIDLGVIPYAEAWARQQHVHALTLGQRDRADAAGPAPAATVLLLEHPPVITISARPGVADHLLATGEQLASMGITVEQTNRGGDITYHGPGQLVAYPIVDLNRFGLRLHDYVRLLEASIIDTLAHFGIAGHAEPGATGVWVHPADGMRPAKIAAMGVRVSRWITLHGLALNINPDLSHFDLIVPCGLVGRPVTSMARVLPEGRTPAVAAVKAALAAALAERLSLAHRSAPALPRADQPHP